VILHCCRQFGRRLTIVALGPLTNLAKAAQKNLRTLKMAGRIVSMGGALRVPGNTGPVAEFNYFVDPEAAQLVLNSALNVTVVPLDITQQVVVMRREIEYRAKRRASNLANFVLRSTRHYMRYHMATEGFDGGYLHDPIAVACVIQPSLIRTTRNRIDVETKGELTRGMTIAGIQRPRTVDVATRIDREGFLKLFHKRLWQ
jgi:purine nucleosidase/pyrimidine-specific ribonucleoside hydrolase